MKHSIPTGTATDLLLEIGRIFTSSTDITALLREVLAAVAGRLPVQRGMISIHDPDSGDIYIDVSHGYTEEEVSRGRYRPGEGVVGSVISSGKPIIIPDVEKDPLFLNRTGARRGGGGSGISFICIPVKLAGDAIGAVSIDVDRVPPRELQAIAEIITSIAIMIAHAVASRREMRAREQGLRDENTRLKERLSLETMPRRLIGNSGVMRDLYEKIAMVAATDTTVLVTGESGTGKELIAEEIHGRSPRRHGPLVKINIASIPENLIESELFGHEKGSFTGAIKQKKGKFELARGGTLFLDEIGDLGAHLQVHLLRALQERTIERVGGSGTIPLDVRIICATHRNLEEMIARGEFRADLYYRINVFPLFSPPLRERKADIILLADHFLELYRAKLGKDIRRLSSDAIDLLASYHWPGNVRELENCIERAVILCGEEAVRNYHLPPSLQTVPARPSPPGTLDEMTDLFVKEIIIDHLKMTGGNITKAAQLLGTTKRILAYKIRRLGIDYSLYRDQADAAVRPPRSNA
jgi:Nif-specific regulatory protein